MEKSFMSMTDRWFCLQVNEGLALIFGMKVGLFLCAGNTKGGSVTVPLTSCLTG